jgi:toxin ParE1/3/4
VTSYRVSPLADRRLDEIYLYTRGQWGDGQAQAYVQSMFEKFDAIATRQHAWRAIPAELGVGGYFCRHEHHFIYWRELEDGKIGIVTILHERMHRIERLREDLKG